MDLPTHRKPARGLRLLALTASALVPIFVASGCHSTSQGAIGATEKKKEEAIRTVKYTFQAENFVGQFEAVKSVEIRARVTGYLDKVNFQDGTEITENTVLFEIDPRSYQAAANRTDALVVQNEAHYKRLELDFKRAQSLISREVMPREEYDRVSGDYAEAAGTLASARAENDLAKLNLNFTKVTSPIAGRLSRRMVDPGNLVRADDTLLTTVVALDPMYVNFDIDERTVLRLRRLILDEKLKPRSMVEWPVFIGLFDERSGGSDSAGTMMDKQEYPHKAVINFSDNHIDVSTGTLRVRAIIANPMAATSKTRMFTPGLAVKIRMPIGDPHPAVLVPVNAISNEQSKKFILVVNNENKLEKRDVVVGGDYEGMQIVTSGLKPGEKVRIVAEGVQSLRDYKLPVNPVLLGGAGKGTPAAPTKPTPSPTPTVAAPAAPKAE